MFSTRRRAFVSVAMAGALTLSAPGIADASPASPGPVPPDVTVLGEAGDWTRFSGPYGWVYGSPATIGNDSLFVLANGTIENVCTGLPGPQTGRLRQRTDGRWTLRDTVDEQRVPTTVYARPEGIDDVFQWFGSVCPGIAGGGAAPEPVASGQGEIYFDAVMESPWWFTFAGPPQPAGKYFNGVRGVVETPDGDRMYLIAEVRYSVDSDTGELHFGRDFMSLKPKS